MQIEETINIKAAQHKDRLCHPLWKNFRLISIPSKCFPQGINSIRDEVLMVLYVSSVADKLESADHFANGEKTQYLSRDYTCRYQLLPVDVPDPTKNPIQGYRICGALSCAEESRWLPNDVYQR